MLLAGLFASMTILWCDSRSERSFGFLFHSGYRLLGIKLDLLFSAITYSLYSRPSLSLSQLLEIKARWFYMSARRFDDPAR